MRLPNALLHYERWPGSPSIVLTFTMGYATDHSLDVYLCATLAV